MQYLFSNFNKAVVIFHNLAYDGRLVRSEFNVDKALEKGDRFSHKLLVEMVMVLSS